MKGAAASIALFLLAACGTTAAPRTHGMFQSGARLRARVIEGDGGAQAFLGWHDATLDVSCVFAAANDGSTRCLPASSQPALFFDAACTERAATFASGTTPPAYVSVADEAKRCDRRFTLHAFRVGNARTTAKIYAGGGGTCGASPLLGGEQAFALSAEIAAPTFAEAHVVIEPRGTALDARVLVTDDGARQVDGGIDKVHGTACGVPRGINGEVVPAARCIPLEGAYDGFFASATCSGERVAYTGDVEGCPAPSTAIQLRSVCDGAATLSLWKLGPESSSAPHFKSGTACDTFAPVGLRLYPEIGPLALVGFPPLASELTGAGRLRNVVLTATDDASAIAEQRPGELFDSAHDAYCTPAAFADGSQRCIDDTAAALSNAYADAACTREIAVAPGRCRKPVYAYSQDTSRAALVRERLDTTTIFRRERGRCEPSAAADGDVFWLVGEAVDLDSAFPSVRERTL